jgi:GT2 family glycosyltransferase
MYSGGRAIEVSVVIPTMNRTDALLRTIDRILTCEPPPDEVLTYVDNGDTSSAEAMRRQFRSVNVLEGSQRIGPGGGRNLLLAAARNEIVASFDDDSFPLDPGYFRRLAATFALNPNAAVVATHIYHRGEFSADARDVRTVTADFVGCGCAFRKSAFETIGGFVPLPLAYGMEESDFALRAHAAGYEIVLDAALRVCHDTDLAHHDSPEVTAASVQNLALFAYLRYPPILWLLGAAQVARRVIWLISHRRLRGLMTGLLSIPGHFRRYRTYRRTVRAQDVKGWLAARRRGAAAVDVDAA